MRSGKYYQGVHRGGEKRDLHRIIAEEMIGRRLNFNEVVHHIDGNINNNDPSNLQVMTRAEHGRLHGLGRTVPEETRQKLSLIRKGVEMPEQRKLSHEQELEALKRHEAGESYRAIGTSMGVCHTTVMAAVNRASKADLARSISL